MKRVSKTLMCILMLAGLVGCGSDQDREQDRQAGTIHDWDRAEVLQHSLARLQSDDPQQRCIGAGDLGKAEVADNSAYEPLCNLLFNDPDVQVRRTVAFTLRDTRYVAGTADLIRCVRTEREETVRLRALEALGQRRDPVALYDLRNLLESRKETMAFYGQAAKALGAYDTEPAAAILCECLRQDHIDVKVRTLVLQELSRQSNVAVPGFKRLLRSEGIDLSNHEYPDRVGDHEISHMPELVKLYVVLAASKEQKMLYGRM